MYSEIINTVQEDIQNSKADSMNVTAYMCKQNWQPIGICSGEEYDSGITYLTKYVSTGKTHSTVSYVQGSVLNLHLAKPNPKIKRLYVICPIAKTGSVAGKNQITLYMFKDGINSPYCLIGQACSSSVVTDLFKWEQVNDYAVDVSIPIPQFCGLKNLLIAYRTNKYREIIPGNIGEITGDAMSLAIGETYIDHYMSLNDELIAGTDYSVFYKSRALGDDYHYFGKFRFETARYTAAIIAGCGLVDNVTPEISGNAETYQLLPGPQTHVDEYWTVQTDDINDENMGKILHYSGIYVSVGLYWKYCGDFSYTVERFISGGANKGFKTYYAGEIERFRWLVHYRGKYSKIKATDFTPWQIGSIVYIAKGIDSDIDSHMLSDADVTDVVSESDKIIRMKIQNYGAVTIDD